MNAYTTTDRARGQPRDMAFVRPTHRVMVGSSLAAREWQRDCHAEAEVEWLLKHNGVMPQASVSRMRMLRQTIGAALVRVGERLAGGAPSGVSPETAPVVGTLGTAT